MPPVGRAYPVTDNTYDDRFALDEAYINGFPEYPANIRPHSSQWPKQYAKRKKCWGPLTKFEVLLLLALGLVLFVFLMTFIITYVISDGFGANAEPPLSEAERCRRDPNTCMVILTTYPPDPNLTVSTPDYQPLSVIEFQENICATQDCVRIAARFAQNMRPEINPCDDFYEFACGRYSVYHTLPINKAETNTISEASDVLLSELRDILNDDREALTDYSWNVMLRDLYKVCIDEEATSEMGLQAMMAIIDHHGGWPVLEGEQWQPPLQDQNANYSWERQVGYLMRDVGLMSVILEISVVIDPEDSEKHALEIDQPKFGMLARELYLNGSEMLNGYRYMMALVAAKFGANATLAEEDLKHVADFEKELARISSSELRRKNKKALHNPMSIRNLQKRYPNGIEILQIDFQALLGEVFGDKTELSDETVVIIKEMSYMKELDRFMSRASARVKQNYIMWRLVNSYHQFLPKDVRQIFYTFEGNQTGISFEQPRQRWEECVSTVRDMLPLPLAAVWIDEYYQQSDQYLSKMDQLAEYLKKSFISGVRKLDWLDSKSMQAATEKAFLLDYRTAFPEKIQNSTFLHDIYGGVDIQPEGESLLDLVIRLRVNTIQRELMDLWRPVDKDMWFMSPATVDAYYAPGLNQMVFPAGIMRFPFLLPNAPNYITFAMAGIIVGHEISHAFDDTGSQYDKNGNLHNWWEKSTSEHFVKKSQCFVQQYGRVYIPEAKISLSGEGTLGENIADNAGLKYAFQAYELWRKKDNVTESILPGFQQFTPQQLFFLAYANNWCTSIRPSLYRNLIMIDPHSPSKYRAIMPLTNSIQFSDAFACPSGSAMNPTEKCELW